MWAVRLTVPVRVTYLIWFTTHLLSVQGGTRSVTLELFPGAYVARKDLLSAKTCLLMLRP